MAGIPKSRPLTWIFAGLAGAFLLAACDEEPVETAAPVRPVRVVKVGVTDQIESREFLGRAKAAREVDLAFRVRGQVLSVSAGAAQRRWLRVLARLGDAGS